MSVQKMKRLDLLFLTKASKYYESSDPQQLAFDEAIMTCIVQDMRPFSVVSGEGFKNLIYEANPKLIVKYRTTFSIF